MKINNVHIFLYVITYFMFTLLKNKFINLNKTILIDLRIIN
jgi:hypothetical protein